MKFAKKWRIKNNLQKNGSSGDCLIRRNISNEYFEFSHDNN